MNRGTIWAWFLQRVTGAALLLVLGIHLWTVHYSQGGEAIVFAEVSARLKTLTFQVVDYGLLAFVLYHGLNGVRNVVLDYNITPGQERVLNWVLSIIGIIFFVYGAYALTPFIAG